MTRTPLHRINIESNKATGKGGTAEPLPRVVTIEHVLTDRFLSDILINASETAYSWFSFKDRKWAVTRDEEQSTVGDAQRFDNKPDDQDLCISVRVHYDRPEDDEGTLKGRFTLDFDTLAHFKQQFSEN